ncbi:hypothetical protein CGRA01v4_06869 [Colletotrichum graminicola]|uniref:GPI anchored serine-threonine rich protein n=1 Tax=Colletotrichum graminicola (strain M1.001 / M2 / FGSC 10212) TaxID=645133 RepID=E3Q2Q3_COLGM|nr:uncharacterized protein GLRG_00026 [Colletotrichum graminicola M1.001]EFQ24882.1 hypothetical protein GLRG_00026 [Colletotrichum graminicola M1.001]WDK15588.1 hypothetical protein CGRA01v4_06869 [Colletotrichum graminicola]
MHLAIPLSLLLILTAATPSPAPAPDDDDDTVCPEGTIACGPVCVRDNQRCCNDPFTADFWSCESAQSCGPSRKEGCRNPANQHPSPPTSPSPSPSPPPGPPTITVSSTTTRTRTVHTQLTPTDADQQPPTCFFDVPLARRAPSDGNQVPCPTSLVSSLDTPAGVPTETGAAAAVPHRRWDVAALAAAVALLV